MKGKSFGWWEVLSNTPYRSSKGIYFLCLCKCGVKRKVSSYRLQNGKSKSCGCYRIENSKKDLTGEVFGRWKVIKREGKNKLGVAFWLCQCSCGMVKKVLMPTLIYKRSLSCGCLNREVIWKHGHTIKGLKSPEYGAWRDASARCRNPKHYSYIDYGGRGIKMCDRWLGKMGFVNFLADMGNKPGKDYSLDRTDTNGNYEPENCRWATKKEQIRNRRYPIRNSVMRIIKEKMISLEKENIELKSIVCLFIFMYFKKALP